MKRKLLTGNAAAAWGARLSQIDYIPAFPITPQTEIIETIGAWIDQEKMIARMTTLESEHSMITAAAAAALTGVRVFTATSSQGLLYAMEMLYTVSGWRAPFVLVNVSRGLASPITLEPDHNDVLAARDSGFLQIHCSTCQEVLDSILIAYRLGENSQVRLPVLVNLDGFYLSFTREPVDIPGEKSVQEFLLPFESGEVHFKASAPVSQAVAVLGGGPYSYFRYETHLAALNALQQYDNIVKEFENIFHRNYEAVEKYKCEDAEIVFVMIGSFATKAKEAVDRLREGGKAVGLLRPRLIRPFPEKHIADVLKGKRGIAVIDQNVSMGKGGILYHEICALLYNLHMKEQGPVALSFIGGLGGRDISLEEFYEMAKVTTEAVQSGTTPPPRLLYTTEELKQVKKLQVIAHTQRVESEPKGVDRG